MMGLSTPAKVGLIAFLALLVLTLMILWKTQFFLVTGGYELIGSFPDIEGLTMGSEVRYRGFNVGRVMRIDPGPHDVKIYVAIKPGIVFPADSQLRVAYDGIVGLKFLEIRPGTSEIAYQPGKILYGVKTLGLVDFVDLGSKNLEETKKIMETIRSLVENPVLQKAFTSAVFTAEKTATEVEKLTAELRATTQGVMKITTDPKFQEDIKQTVGATARTLTSANRFFESFSKMNVRPTAGMQLGTTANAVRGNIDIIQTEKNYFSIGMGEGPTRTLGLLDILFTTKATERFGYRLGVINSQLGGGIMFYPSENWLLRGDIYDINNPRPNWPKLRFTYELEMREYLDFLLQGDDLINSDSRNIALGIRVKPPGEKIY